MRMYFQPRHKAFAKMLLRDYPPGSLVSVPTIVENYGRNYREIFYDLRGTIFEATDEQPKGPSGERRTASGTRCVTSPPCPSSKWLS